MSTSPATSPAQHTPTPASNAPAAAATLKRSAPCDEVSFYSKKARTEAPPIQQFGKHVGRTMELFDDMKVILTDGNAADDDDLRLAELSDPLKHKRLLQFQAMVDFCPELEEGLQIKDGLSICAQMINKGRTNARTEDTNTLKGEILEILRAAFAEERVAGLKPVSKVGRGFDNDLTGELLCPWSVDIKDPQVREELRNGTNANVTAEIYPAFMFYGYKAIRGQLAAAFFRSDLLIRAYICIFISPSAASANDVSASRSNKPGNAALHHQAHVTVPSLAYVAMQLRFALSSEETFKKEGHGTFNNSRFYYNIIRHFEAAGMEDRTRALLKWWDAKIFPSAKSTNGAADDFTSNEMLREVLGDISNTI